MKLDVTRYDMIHLIGKSRREQIIVSESARFRDGKKAVVLEGSKRKVFGVKTFFLL